MKTTILVLMAASAVGLNHSANAENNAAVMPPPGPYKSVDDIGQYNPDRNVQNRSQVRENYSHLSAQPNREIPEWVRQRQAQMEQRMQQQSNIQPPSWNNQQPQWNYNQPPMPNVYSGRAPDSGIQDNRFQPTFPAARGPVYGPGAMAPEFYQQPVYQGPRY